MFIFLIVEIIFLIGIVILEFTNSKYSTLPKGLQVGIRIVMLMPLLGFVLTSGNLDVYKILLILALSVAMIADTLIIFSFILGLGSFFVMHALLLTAFSTQIYINPLNSVSTLISLVILALVIYFCAFLEVISSNIVLAIVLVVYLLLMTLEVWASIIGVKGIILVTGISLFFACDAQVAYINFKSTFPFSQQINHILYYGALILITFSGVI